jgi:nucleoside-diphosphate-sugar epimerase
MVLKFLVTGATGFIGFHVVEALYNQGFPVEALVREGSETSRLTSRGVRVRAANWLDPTSSSEALLGGDVLIHLAGLTRARSESEFRVANADLVGSLVEASIRAGIRRIVLVSSLAAAGPGTEAEPRGEFSTCQPVTAYGRSKLLGEKKLREVGSRLSWSIVRPPVVYGPWDRDVFQLFRMAQRGIVPVLGFGERRNSVLFGPDLARHLVDLALSESLDGRTLHLAESRSYSWREIALSIGEAVGVRPRIVPIPPIVARASAALGSVGGWIRRKPSLVSWQKIPEILAPGWVTDPGDAHSLLPGVGSTTLSEGTKVAARWYEQQGWLKRLKTNPEL